VKSARGGLTSGDKPSQRDEIIVLKDGLIAERGTHRQLLKQKGLYASMWDRQREADEAEERLRQVRESDDMGVVVRGTPAAE